MIRYKHYKRCETKISSMELLQKINQVVLSEQCGIILYKRGTIREEQSMMFVDDNKP